MTNVKIGVIGGSGLGQALGGESGRRLEVDTPFGKPSAPLITTEWEGTEVVILQRHGERHTFNPTTVPYRANIFALKTLGVTHIIASGATGSLREDIRPRDLVVTEQVIDKTTRRPHTFYEKAAVHVELSEPFCPVLRRWLIAAGRRLANVTVHESATYVCMEGPAFSTRAESHLHRAWGADLIGMTGCPEFKLAKEAEIAYAQLALPTDYDCWRPHDASISAQALLEEIIGNLQAATENSLALIREALADIRMLRESRSPSHDALALAIWTDKTAIPTEEIERLRPLWGRYFDGRKEPVLSTS